MVLNLQPARPKCGLFCFDSGFFVDTSSPFFVQKRHVPRRGLSHCGGMVHLVTKLSVACEKRRRLGNDSLLWSEGEGHMFKAD